MDEEPDRPDEVAQQVQPVQPSRVDTAASVALIVLAWVGAAAVLAVLLFSLTFLDDCDPPACQVTNGVHAYYVGVAVTAVLALLAARWTFAGRERRRRWPRALLALTLVAGCVVATTVGTYAALDLHPDEFEQQQLR